MSTIEGKIKKVFSYLKVEYELVKEKDQLYFIFKINLRQGKIEAGLICNQKFSENGYINYLIQINLGEITTFDYQLLDVINSYNYKSAYYKTYINDDKEIIIETNQTCLAENLDIHLQIIIETLLKQENNPLQDIVDKLTK